MFSNFFNRWLDNPQWTLSPIKYQEESSNNFGGKVLLPQSILADLVDLQIYPPYIFSISLNNGKSTHCGVLEFTAGETQVVVPRWMYNQLCMSDTEEVTLKFVTLQMGTHLKLLPHSPVFLEIDNPKLELENVLKNYPTLSLGDVIECFFEEHDVIKFTVVKIEPRNSGGIYTVDTDLTVDFSEPIGYKEQIEDEKTVNKYVDIIGVVKGVKIVKMKKLGIAFNIEK